MEISENYFSRSPSRRFRIQNENVNIKEEGKALSYGSVFQSPVNL